MWAAPSLRSYHHLTKLFTHQTGDGCGRVGALLGVDDECGAREAEAEITRPARADASMLNQKKPHRIGEGEILVRESPETFHGAGVLARADGRDAQRFRLFNHG